MSEIEMASSVGGTTRRPFRRAVVVLAMCVVVVLVLAVAAVAFFTASGAGPAAAVIGSLSPATISAPVTSGIPVTITWTVPAVATTASLDDKITYDVLRRQGAGSFVPVTAGSCASSLAEGTTSCEDSTVGGNGAYSYEVVANLGSFSAASNVVAVNVAVTPPTDAVALVSPVGAYLVSSTATAYLNATSGGSFGLSDTVRATGTTPASASFPGISANGWSGHTTSEMVSSGSGGGTTITYASSTRYDFAANAASVTGTISSVDALGNTSSGTDLSFVPVAGPTAGSLSAAGTSATSTGSSVLTSATSYPLNWTDFSADASGVASSSLSVRFAPWSSNACGSYGSATTITAGSPASQTEPSGDGCYQYRLAETDNVGLSSSLVTTVEVDTSAPVTTDDSASMSGWQDSTQTVTLSPSDNGSGPAQTYFTTDGTAPAEVGGVPRGTTQMGTSVVLSSSGTFTIEYFSVDKAGNVEPTRTAASLIRIDLVPPSVPSPIVNGHS